MTNRADAAQLARDLRRYKHLHIRPHPLRDSARKFFSKSQRKRIRLCTSAEVVQELAHAYLPVERLQTFDAAMSLIVGLRIEVWPLEYEDVTLARQLHEQYPMLSARDLCHVASCRRRGVRVIKTFDRALRAVGQTPPTGSGQSS